MAECRSYCRADPYARTRQTFEVSARRTRALQTVVSNDSRTPGLTSRTARVARPGEHVTPLPDTRSARSSLDLPPALRADPRQTGGVLTIGSCYVLAAALLAVGLGAAWAAEHAAAPAGARPCPSPVLFPPQTLALSFDHRKHTEKASCTRCHDTAATSTRAADRNLPDQDRCAECHPVRVSGPEQGDPAQLCGFCHPAYLAPGGAPRFRGGATVGGRAEVSNPPPLSSVPAPYLRFDHSAHARAGIDCLTCHARVPGLGKTTRCDVTPLMEDCRACHDGRRASDRCRTCHLTDGAGLVRWRLPTGLLRPSGRAIGGRHDEAFVERHAPAARRRPDVCRSCHDDRSCQRCHDGLRKPARIHPGNWMALHGVSARKDPRGCAGCHDSQGSCIVCHRRSHVVREGDDRFPIGRRFHPEGWAVASGLPGPRHHGREARRNLRACASCHEEKTCVRCHGTQSLGGGTSPHGRGFRDRCEAMLRRSSRACHKCHAPADPLLERCR